MKKITVFIISISFYGIAIAQEQDKPILDERLKEVSETGCQCVDSISTSNQSRIDVVTQINKCIDQQTVSYKSTKVTDEELNDSTAVRQSVDTLFDTNKKAIEYKKYYYEIEEYMMKNCTSLQKIITIDDKRNSNSISDYKEARKLYNKGVKIYDKKNYQKAIQYYQEAIAIDSLFTFAWDNLGLSYRKLKQYDKAIEAYQKSLEIDPYGTTPLQNIAVVYQYKKEYSKAINAYKKLALIDKDDPEVFYGLGVAYAIHLEKYEEGLEYMCKAYRIYDNQNSPYRVDSQKVIKIIYSNMKKQGKGDKFKEILNNHNISTK